MSKGKKDSRKPRKHTGRYILIFGIIVVAVVVAAALSAPSGPQFFLTVHVYDGDTDYPSFGQLPPGTIFVEGSTVTITGPRNFGPETTPTGVLAISSQIPGGSYTITANKAGYTTGTVAYQVGANCAGGEVLLDGNVVCHAIVRITATA